MNNKTWKQKSIEQHKRFTRDMVSYVRYSVLLNTLAEEYDKTLHDVDYLKRRLTDDDLIIADLLIKNGVDIDDLTNKFADLENKDYVCPYIGGIK